MKSNLITISTSTEYQRIKFTRFTRECGYKLTGKRLVMLAALPVKRLTVGGYTVFIIAG